MEIKDFYIKGIYGKDLGDLEKFLSFLPDNFIPLNKDKIVSLELKYTPKNEKGKPDIQISVRTEFPEEIKLNIPFNSGIREIFLHPGDHFRNSEHRFNYEGISYIVSNNYNSIIPATIT